MLSARASLHQQHPQLFFDQHDCPSRSRVVYQVNDGQRKKLKQSMSLSLFADQ